MVVFGGTFQDNGMWFYCIKRHGWYVNLIFMDWSVRRVPLKGLWDLKWHREYDLNALKPVFAGTWMEKCPEWKGW